MNNFAVAVTSPDGSITRSPDHPITRSPDHPMFYVGRVAVKFAQEIDQMQGEQMEMYQPGIFKVGKRRQKMTERPGTKGEMQRAEPK